MTDAQFLVQNARVSPEVAHVVILAARRFHIKVKDLRGPSRLPRLVMARRWAVVRARNLKTTSSDYRHRGCPSYWEIGRALNRDHSTIRYAEKMALSAPCIGRKG